VDEFPLTYHALEVWENQKKDPLAMFTERANIEIARNSLGSDSVVDLCMRWIEALYFADREKAASSLSDWLMSNYSTHLTQGNVYYISQLKSKLNTPLNTIRFLASGVRRDGKLLNLQTLRTLFPKHYYTDFSKVSSEVDVYLLLSVARQESGFNPVARSRANARGLLQIIPGTAKRLGNRNTADLYNPEKNIKLGTKFLAQLIDRFQSAELSLAAYNAGPNRIPEWQRRYGTTDSLLFMDLIPFKETRNYVSSILRNNY
jgi:soluble lytic murein transglycosylase